MQEWSVYLRDKADAFDITSYETSTLSLRRVDHIAEVRYGVHFKDTNEFGLYGAFYADDGKVFRSYYRSDANFEKQEYLDRIHMDEPI
jgi:hypothetical protein